MPTRSSSCSAFFSIFKLPVLISVHVLLLLRFHGHHRLLTPPDHIWPRESGASVLSLIGDSSADVEMLVLSNFETSKNETTPASNGRKNETEQSTKRRPRILPNGKVNVIIFMHLYKTGGTTVRRYLRNLKLGNTTTRLLEYSRVEDSNVTDIFQRAEHRIRKRPDWRTLFLEIHPDRLHKRIGLKQYFEEMQRLRKVAAAHNRSIFTFSLVREPIDFYRSYFSFFHSEKCVQGWCAHPQERFNNLTEENMLKVAKPNHQSMLLAGDSAYGQDFDLFLSQLEETFDWIGTTEQLSITTMPLLSKIMTNGALLPEEDTANTGARRKVPMSNQTALSILQDRSKWDRLLYEWVQKTYSFPETAMR